MRSCVHRHYECIGAALDIATAILKVFLAVSLENDNVSLYIGVLSCVSRSETFSQKNTGSPRK